MSENRREFIKKAALAGLGASALTITPNNIAAAEEKTNQTLIKPTKEKIKIGFIGVGLRGEEHVKNALAIQGVEVPAICDLDQSRNSYIQNMCEQKGFKKPEIYTGSDFAFEKMLKRGDLDAVIISTPWEWHSIMAVSSMKAGLFTGVEVSAANTVEECWDLVNVHEQTGSHLMILENVCYRRDVMAVLNMVRTNVFGEQIHARCGYQHDLRNVKFNDGKTVYSKGSEFGDKALSEAHWRTQHSVKRNGDLYPTHGVGPIGIYLNINRGNRFLSITSMATKSRGLHDYLVKNGGENHPNARVMFNLGDVVMSMIKCANGETVLVTHDTNLPRPYSLGFRMQGVKGLWENDGDRIYVEGVSNPHEWDDSKKWLDKYDHIFWKKHGEKALGAGHGGMDYILMADFVDAVKNNKPAPLDAYDAAAWSAISGLSEMSVSRGSSPVDFPDFTRGQWIKRKPYFALDENFPIAPEQSY